VLAIATHAELFICQSKPLQYQRCIGNVWPVPFVKEHTLLSFALLL
jgi:hypothetical protein